MAKISSPITAIIKAYQYGISPLLGNCCRFYPSCSRYSLEAIESFGLIKGSFLSIKRILKCQPFSKGGFDPLPSINNHAN